MKETYDKSNQLRQQQVDLLEERNKEYLKRIELYEKSMETYEELRDLIVKSKEKSKN
ncbi:hypothetical protein [Peribacillus asahii]|uniref:hypothetical protein n=1 Tax=Peribacillus asahii TaxID=228899 RepID=UPI003823BE9B